MRTARSRAARRNASTRAVVSLFAFVLMFALVLSRVLAAPCGALAAVSQIEGAKSATVAIYDSSAEIIGSGVLVAPEWVLTAAHVVKAVEANGFDHLLLTQDNKQHSYSVKAVSNESDLALLYVAGLSGPVIGSGLGAQPGTGDEVYALGYPLGLTAISVTRGVISAPVQTIEGIDFLQTDASINPGNSGGPLVDGQGRLIGINVMKPSAVGVDGMGFAVPPDAVQRFLAGTPVGSMISSGSSGGVAGGSGGGAQSGDAGGFLLLMTVAIAGGVGYLLMSSRRRQPIAPPAGVTRAESPELPVVKYILSGPGGRREGSARLPAVLGRSSTADIVIEDNLASRHHGRLSATERGGVRVHDLSSRNGIYVGDAKKEELDFPVGAVFRIGETTVTRTG